MPSFVGRLADLFKSPRSTRRQCKLRTIASQTAELEPRLLLTVGADGWTKLAPSADSRMVYVSSSTGNDANNGLSPDSPLKTIRFARSKLRSSSADWLLLKNGDVFREGAISWDLRGRSAAEPLVITGYGSGSRPVLRETSLSYYWNSNSPAGFSLDNLTVFGLEFQGDAENNPTASGNKLGILLSGPMKNVVLENNLITGYGSGVNAQIKNASTDDSETLSFRRNVVADNGDFGILVSDGNNVLLEENVFDRNGWGGSGPTMLKHNVYLKHVDDAVLRDNIFARGGNFGTKLSSDKPGEFRNFVIENNLYYNNGISLDHSAGATGDVQTTFTHEDGVIARNVFTELGRTFSNGVIQDMAGWVLNTRNVTWDENLFVHKPPVSTGIILNWGQHHQDITVKDSVVYDWNLDKSLPSSAYLSYKADQIIDGYTSINNEINLPAESYVDPTRTVGSYYASIGGTNDAIAFLKSARGLSKANWNVAFTATQVNDYISAGFAHPGVVDALATPVFLTPNNMTTPNSLLTVNWSTSNGADGYEVAYSNMTTGQNSAFTATTVSSSYTPATALPLGQYQIKVRATQEGGPASEWSQPLALRINTAPVLDTLPADAVNPRPQLRWTPVPGAVRYEVKADNITTGVQKVVNATNVTETTFTPVSDLGFSEYRFSVRGVDANGRALEWSVGQTYARTRIATVVQPVTFDGLNSVPSIRWGSVPGARRYELWVSNQTTGDNAVLQNAQILGSSFIPDRPLPFGKNIFRVRALDADGAASKWSVPVEAMNLPALLTPSAPTFERRPTFSWAALPGVGSSELYLTTNGTVITKDVGTNSSWTPDSDLPLGDLDWRVRFKTATGLVGLWSPTIQTNIGGRSSILTAAVPSNDSGRLGVFTWKAVTGASHYILKVERIGYGTVLMSGNLTGTSYTTSVPLAAGQYRAWIIAVQSPQDVTGQWSIAFAFSVVGVKTQENRLSEALVMGTRYLESGSDLQCLPSEEQPIRSEIATSSKQDVRAAEFFTDPNSRFLTEVTLELPGDRVQPAGNSVALLSEHVDLIDADLIDMVMSESYAFTALYA